MHLARGRLALRHRASSISRPSVDSCLRSDRIRLMDASSLSAKRDGDGGEGREGLADGWSPRKGNMFAFIFISSEF